MIMKKLKTNHSYCSPRVELVVLAIEQAVMAGSAAQVPGLENEDFVKGGTYSDWN